MLELSRFNRCWSRRPHGALVPLAAVLLSPVASAEVLFNGDFETGDLSQWDRTLNETKDGRRNLRVVDAPVYRGNSAAEMVIHEDDRFNASIFRVEVHKAFDTTGEGDETFVSWYFMYPEEAKHWNLIGYWESDKSYDLSMDFRVYPEDDGTTSIAFVSKQESDRDRTEHWRQPLVVGQWHQLAMHVKWSVRADDGRVSVWYDGKSVVEDVALATKNDGNRLFMQIGLMRIRETGPTETIYIDEAIEATSLEEILAKPEEFQSEESPPVGGGGQGGMPGGAGGLASMGGAAGNGAVDASQGGMAGGGAGALPPGVEAAGGVAVPSMKPAEGGVAGAPSNPVGTLNPVGVGGAVAEPPRVPEAASSQPAVAPPLSPPTGGVASVTLPATTSSVEPPGQAGQAGRAATSGLHPVATEADGGCRLAPAKSSQHGAWLWVAVGLMLGLARRVRRPER